MPRCYPSVPYGVHRFEVPHVGQPDRGLQQMLPSRAGVYEQGIDPRQGIAGLLGDVMLGFTYLTGEEHRIAVNDDLAHALISVLRSMVGARGAPDNQTAWGWPGR